MIYKTMKHPATCRPAIAPLAALLLCVPAVAYAADDQQKEAARQAVVEALSEDFPLPKNCRLLGREWNWVRVGVEDMSFEELVAFFETELEKAGYRIIKSEDAGGRNSLAPGVERGWTIATSTPGGESIKGINIELKGGQLSFMTHGKKQSTEPS